MERAGRGPIVDLHTHSTASDGLHSPAELVDLAAQRGLCILALTDHDTTQGLDEAIAAGDAAGVEVIPGVELGTDAAAGELHLLGYFIDRRNEEFLSALERFRAGRRDRARRIAWRLSEAGLVIDIDAIEAEVGAGSVGRQHIARALVAGGYTRSIEEAFARYLMPGRPGYVPRPRLSPADAVALIHRAGGAAVLAHPLTVDDPEAALRGLVEVGLDGLEVFYAAYTGEQRAYLAALAEQYDLIATGGSDFHGVGEREERALGSVEVPVEAVERLREAARLRARPR